VLADLAQIEKKVERVRQRKGANGEAALCRAMQNGCEEGSPLRTLGLTAEEQNASRGLLPVRSARCSSCVNAPRGRRRRGAAGRGGWRGEGAEAECAVLSAAVEAEVARLDAGDRAAFLAISALRERHGSLHPRELRVCST
jgi:hypothetical protein